MHGHRTIARFFYESFRMKFVKHSHGTGPVHYAYEDEGYVFELYPSKTGTSDEMTALGFRVDNLEQTRNLLIENGDAPGALKETPWGRTFVVRDPDGRRVEIKA